MWRSNIWKGIVLGMAGGAAGLVAMQWYWDNVAPQVDEWGAQLGLDQPPQSDELDDMSMVGQQHEEGEAPTAAVGRIAQRELSGTEPETEETKVVLSEMVHWGYGIMQGGVYGLLRAHGPFPDLKFGAVFGTGLWLAGDEMAVPMLGLQQGPTAVSPIQHINRFGAHVVYGATTAMTTQLLRRLVFF
jgi:uncharacterized membrane protein YagU involved in acid resistance